MKKDYIIIKFFTAFILMTIGALWLCKVSLLLNGNHISFFQSASSGIASAFLLSGFMLIRSCVFNNKFITILSTAKMSITYRLFADITSGSLLAFAILFMLAFLSPPFPFVCSLTCATGWNDIELLIPAMVLLLLRYPLVREDLKKEDNWKKLK